MPNLLDPRAFESHLRKGPTNCIQFPLHVSPSQCKRGEEVSRLWVLPLEKGFFPSDVPVVGAAIRRLSRLGKFCSNAMRRILRLDTPQNFSSWGWATSLNLLFPVFVFVFFFLISLITRDIEE